jgi:sulfopyruvate decarboxylase subunit beta
MKRIEALRAIMAVVTAEPVVCTLGHTAQELYQLGDRPENFYMLGSMGMATPIAHGIALARPGGKVIAIDGDAAVTMNMGALATIGLTRAPNLVVAIIDNQANGATGFQPSMTAARLRLDEVARGCGIARVVAVTTQPEVRKAVAGALAEDGPHLIVIETETGAAPGLAVIPLAPDVIRDRFKEKLAS